MPPMLPIPPFRPILAACFAKPLGILKPPLPFENCFIIFAVCSYCVMSLFTSDTCTPAPAAILFLLLALRIEGDLLSFLVIEVMIAICLSTILSSRSSSLILPAAPGIMPTRSLSEPIFFICSNCEYRSSRLKLLPIMRSIALRASSSSMLA